MSSTGVGRWKPRVTTEQPEGSDCQPGQSDPQSAKGCTTNTPSTPKPIRQDKVVESHVLLLVVDVVVLDHVEVHRRECHQRTETDDRGQDPQFDAEEAARSPRPLGSQSRGGESRRDVAENIPRDDAVSTHREQDARDRGLRGDCGSDAPATYAAVKKVFRNCPPAASMTSVVPESTSANSFDGNTNCETYDSTKKMSPDATVAIMIAFGTVRVGSFASSERVDTASKPRKERQRIAAPANIGVTRRPCRRP